MVSLLKFETPEETNNEGNEIKVKAAHFSQRSPFFGVNSVKSQGRLVEYHFPSRSNSPDMSVAVGAVTGKRPWAEYVTSRVWWCGGGVVGGQE